MGEHLRLEMCDACGTAIPVTAPVCPSCGAPQPGRDAAGHAPQGAAGLEDLLRTLEGVFEGDGRSARRVGLGLGLRHLLGRRIGCVGLLVALVFGLPVLVGALFGHALGGLAVALLVVGGLGLLVGAGILWALWGARPPRRR